MTTKKIIILRRPGSGKSTYAIRLGEELDIPVYHLDKVNFKGMQTRISEMKFVLCAT